VDIRRGGGDPDADDGRLYCQASLALGVLHDLTHALAITVQNRSVQVAAVDMPVIYAVLMLRHSQTIQARHSIEDSDHLANMNQGCVDGVNNFDPWD
jgi:hypothetical protein